MSKTEGIRILLTEVIHDVDLPEFWLEGMAEEKRNRICSLRNEADRRLCMTAHRLLCIGLMDIFGLSPSPEDWATGWHGKPYLKNAPHVHYNISHSGNIGMCALHYAPVGVDIERKSTYDNGAMRRIMSKKELAVFYAAPEKDDLFYKIWTLKEAYAKYCGRGLSDIQRLTIYPDGDTIVSNVSGCRFALIDTAPGYQAALCAADVRYSAEWIKKETLINF